MLIHRRHHEIPPSLFFLEPSNARGAVSANVTPATLTTEHDMTRVDSHISSQPVLLKMMFVYFPFRKVGYAGFAEDSTSMEQRIYL